MTPRWLVAALLALAASKPGHGTPADEYLKMGAALGTLPVASVGGMQRRQQPAGPGVVSMPITHGAAPGLQRREVTAPLTARSDVAYYMELQLGTPPQRVRVQVDTDSFELWVNADCDALSEAGDARFCRSNGRYEPGRSDSARRLADRKALQYGIGAANVSYVRDTMALAGARGLSQVRFGVADSSRDQFSGILGLGFGRGVGVGYNSFVDELALQGVTRTRAFSVGLGSKAEARGQVTFGGVDTSRFAGRLAPLAIIPAESAPDRVPRYWVSLRSIAHSPPGPAAAAARMPDSALPVFLDTGATLTLLPPGLVRSMAASLGVAVDDPAAMLQDSLYRLPCDLMGRQGSFDFEFDGVTVFVPYREIIRRLAPAGEAPVCYLGIMQSQKFSLLGDTFMRSAYVVFDLDRNMTYMARQANCGSSPEAISPTTDLAQTRGRCGESSLARDRLARGPVNGAAASGPALESVLAAAAAAAACALVLGLA